MTLSHSGRRLLQACLLAAAACLSLPALADAAALKSVYTQLQPELRSNAYGRAIHIDSTEQDGVLKGDVYAVLDHPFETVRAGLKTPEDWCKVLILPFNTKYCRPATGANGPLLQLRIGRKADQAATEAYPLELAWHPVASADDFFETRLTAAEGPLGTRDYHIALSATPLDARRTFMHLTYSYASGGMGRIAMQTYLNTVGAKKVGFTVVGRDAGGQPQYIGGMRGVIERNVMRYYLAIDAYLASLSAPPDQQLERRITAWFDNSERYARQLHEMDRETYIALKRNETQRQQTALQ